MATNVAVLLEALGAHVLSSSVKERKAVLTRLNAWLTAPESPEAADKVIKAAMGLLVQTQYVYVDHASRALVVQALSHMMALNPALVGKALVKLTAMHATQLTKALRVEGGGVAVGFVWATLVLRQHPEYAEPSGALRSHLASMATILRAAVVSKHRAANIALKALQAVLRLPGRPELLLDQALAMSPSPDSFVFAAAIVAAFQRSNVCCGGGGGGGL